MMRGKRSHTSAGVAIALAVASLAAAPVRGGDGFLIPGVALSEAVFEVGAWCRYLVVDEIMGALDSTTVSIAVTGRVERQGIAAWWLELDSGPVGAPPGEREVASALISSGIKHPVPGEPLHHYVLELYVKKGTGDMEPADPADLEQLTLSNPSADADWVMEPGQEVRTPRGAFRCDHKHLVVRDDREIDMGRITLVKNDTDAFDVWLCREVPIFRVAKCVIERVRDSRTVPPVPGIPNRGREETRTTIEVLDFGANAESKIRIR